MQLKVRKQMESNENGMQSAHSGELITSEERESFLRRRGWVKANTEERLELAKYWTDDRIRMALDLNLG